MRHFAPKTAQTIHVASAAGLLDRSGAQEQPSLKQSMIEAMKKTGGDAKRRT
jgi:hypothetical protein